jgi:hypothetical protein
MFSPWTLDLDFGRSQKPKNQTTMTSEKRLEKQSNGRMVYHHPGSSRVSSPGESEGCKDIVWPSDVVSMKLFCCSLVCTPPLHVFCDPLQVLCNRISSLSHFSHDQFLRIPTRRTPRHFVPHLKRTGRFISYQQTKEGTGSPATCWSSAWWLPCSKWVVDILSMKMYQHWLGKKDLTPFSIDSSNTDYIDSKWD